MHTLLVHGVRTKTCRSSMHLWVSGVCPDRSAGVGQLSRLEPMSLTLDSREFGLIALFCQAACAHQVSSLDVGDVMCRYDNGRSWVCERKRADDFAASIKDCTDSSRERERQSYEFALRSMKDGRWRDQSARLFSSGHRVIYVFEGDFRETGMYLSLIHI